MKRIKSFFCSIIALVLLVTASLGFTGNLAKAGDSGQTDISVLSLKSGHNGTILTFELSGSDYAGLATYHVGDKHTEYNYWSNIKIYTSDTTYTTLGEAFNNQKYYNMWGMENTISLELKADVYNAAKKIEIPKGTVFPAYAYTGGTPWGGSFVAGSSSEPGGFVTTESILLTKPDNAVEGSGYNWTLTEFKEANEIETAVTNIHIRTGSSPELLLFLSGHDYSGAAGTTAMTAGKIKEYNILDKITVYKSDTEYAKLSDVVSGNAYYNIWGEAGSVAIELIAGWDGSNIQKVVVEAGCQFPSYQYTNNNATVKNAYSAKDKTIFTTTPPSDGFSINWERSIVVPSVQIDTAVTEVRLMGAPESMRLILFLSEQDYANVENSAACSERFKDYNTLDHVYLLVDDNVQPVPLSDIATGEEVYYNLWGMNGSISYELKPEYQSTSFTKVLIGSGCEFPAYSYTATDTEEKKAYTTTEEKELAITQTLYKVSYYDENGNSIFEDELTPGSELTLRSVPVKEGYIGAWIGMKYTVMPAKNISYTLSYTKEQDEDNEAHGGENSGGSSTGENGSASEEKDSSDQNSDKSTEKGNGVATGDTNSLMPAMLTMILSALALGAMVTVLRCRKR